MRVLFHAPPLVGHTLPMLPLARALRARGHAVVWAAGAAMQPLLRAHGFECLTAGPDRAWAMAELSRQWPERAALTPPQLATGLAPRLFAGVYAPATLPGLLAVVDAWQPELVLHDVMAHAAPLAAALRGLRSVSHGFGLPRPRSLIDGAAACMAPQWQTQGLSMPADSGNHRGGHVDICPPSLRMGEPLPDGPRWPLSPASGVRRRLGPRQGVLVSFGTVHHAQVAFDRLLNVLRRGPWTVRAALGRPVDAAQRWPAHVQAAPWLDLPVEWATCQVGACHGGAGTVLGALAQGVPLLLLPVAADHFRNARALRACGAGITLEGEQQTELSIHRALQRLHEEPSLVAAAIRVADELAAMPQADDVAQALVC